MIFGGILSPIEDPLTDVLIWLHTSVGLTWGWSIVVLTVLIRVVILPLTIKQIRSMQKLQAHAPELKAIQQKYKGDKQRTNEEVMKFYRENKVNPAASCLPILLQIPIFIALFFVLRDFPFQEEDPGSSLSWLIVPDITANVSSHWSGFALLVVYVISQLSSTFFMATTLDRNQRLLFLALPFIFIPFIIRFPTGLMIYWSTTNLWTVGQGLVTRRVAPKPQLPGKRSSRTPPKEVAQAPAATKAKPEPKAEPAAEAVEQGDGAQQPAKPTQPGQRRVRRRKKKRGPQAGRRR